MWMWIAENAVTIICIAVIALIIAAAVIVLVKDKKKGSSSCDGNCAHCPRGSSCHKE